MPALPRPADTEGVEIRLVDSIATITLVNEPRKNAITNPMWSELADAFRWAGSDEAVRVVVVTGAGSEFCSGADLSSGPQEHWLRHMRSINEGCAALHAIAQPTIARIDGIAAGAGLNLALGCDLVVASERSRFSEIFSKRGLSIDYGGSWVLPRRIGIHRAKELALLAPIIGAAEAERMGLINKVVPVDQLDGAVGEWASTLAAGPPIALAQTKALLDRGLTSSLDAALAAEAAAQTVNFGTRDTSEAIAAFIEKRSPEYEGR